MRKEKKDKHFLKKAYYPGGSAAMSEFIRKNLRYPKEALEKGIEGTVSLRYSINYKGIVEEVEILHSLGYGCDEEATRLAKLLRFKVPKNRGVRVLFHKKINIHFKLPTKKKISVSYNYQQTKSEEKKSPQDGSGYSYTIDI